MTDHHIPFSVPMTLALLEGRKTQTRRPQGKRGPYAVGDRLWVREAHALVPASAYRCSEGVAQAVNPSDSDHAAIYRAGFDRSTSGFRWRPSIHMPRWASRLTLTVTDVRLQRLIEISEADAWAEGCRKGDATDNGGYFPADEADPSGIGERGWDCARDWYADLWDNIHGPDAWDANPLVWAYTFTVARGNIDQIGGAA